MERFLREITSTYWWLAVAVAIAVNLVSNYLQRGLDVVLSKVSQRWRTRVATREAKRRQEAEELRDSVQGQLALLWSELRTEIQVSQFLVATVACFGFAMLLNIRYEKPSILVMILILFLQITGFAALVQTDRLSRKARRERSLLRELADHNQVPGDRED
jgi:hypothetical protein